MYNCPEEDNFMKDTLDNVFEKNVNNYQGYLSDIVDASKGFSVQELRAIVDEAGISQRRKINENFDKLALIEAISDTDLEEWRIAIVRKKLNIKNPSDDVYSIEQMEELFV